MGIHPAGGTADQDSNVGPWLGHESIGMEVIVSRVDFLGVTIPSHASSIK